MTLYTWSKKKWICPNVQWINQSFDFISFIFFPWYPPPLVCNHYNHSAVDYSISSNFKGGRETVAFENHHKGNQSNIFYKMSLFKEGKSEIWEEENPKNAVYRRFVYWNLVLAAAWLCHPIFTCIRLYEILYLNPCGNISLGIKTDRLIYYTPYYALF